MENIGSALKSIISRYGELKTSPSTLIDAEGEELNFNKVDTALKSVGVSMHDANGQFRAFDDVIMDLAKTWQTLDRNSQRYIATVMAGNRQQSRFIALVSDYERLSELTEEAANAQDAGTLQYLKTLDSIESKINQLQVAFQEFYTSMGLEDLFKGALDGLTTFITQLNSLPKLFGTIPVAAIGMGANLILAIKNILSMVGILFYQEFQKVKNAITEVTGTKHQIKLSVNKEEFKQEVKEAVSEGIAAGQRTADGNKIDLLEGAGGKTRKQLRAEGFFDKNEKHFWENSIAKVMGNAIKLIGATASTALLTRQNTGESMINTHREQSKVWSGAAGLGFNLLGGFISGGPLGALIGLAQSIPNIITLFDGLEATSKEVVAQLDKEIQEQKNKVIVQKDEVVSLEAAAEKLEELRDHQYDSVEANQEYIDYMNQLGNSHSELISRLNEEGNSVVELKDVYQQLIQSRSKLSEEELKQRRLELQRETVNSNEVQRILSLSSRDVAKLTPGEGGIATDIIRDAIQNGNYSTQNLLSLDASNLSEYTIPGTALETVVKNLAESSIWSVVNPDTDAAAVLKQINSISAKKYNQDYLEQLQGYLINLQLYGEALTDKTKELAEVNKTLGAVNLQVDSWSTQQSKDIILEAQLKQLNQFQTSSIVNLIAGQLDGLEDLDLNTQEGKAAADEILQPLLDAYKDKGAQWEQEYANYYTQMFTHTDEEIDTFIKSLSGQEYGTELVDIYQKKYNDNISDFNENYFNRINAFFDQYNKQLQLTESDVKIIPIQQFARGQWDSLITELYDGVGAYVEQGLYTQARQYYDNYISLLSTISSKSLDSATSNAILNLIKSQDLTDYDSVVQLIASIESYDAANTDVDLSDVIEQLKLVKQSLDYNINTLKENYITALGSFVKNADTLAKETTKGLEYEDLASSMARIQTLEAGKNLELTDVFTFDKEAGTYVYTLQGFLLAQQQSVEEIKKKTQEDEDRINARIQELENIDIGTSSIKDFFQANYFSNATKSEDIVNALNSSQFADNSAVKTIVEQAIASGVYTYDNFIVWLQEQIQENNELLQWLPEQEQLALQQSFYNLRNSLLNSIDWSKIIFNLPSSENQRALESILAASLPEGTSEDFISALAQEYMDMFRLGGEKAQLYYQRLLQQTGAQYDYNVDKQLFEGPFINAASTISDLLNTQIGDAVSEEVNALLVAAGASGFNAEKLGVINSVEQLNDAVTTLWASIKNSNISLAEKNQDYAAILEGQAKDTEISLDIIKNSFDLSYEQMANYATLIGETLDDVIGVDIQKDDWGNYFLTDTGTEKLRNRNPEDLSKYELTDVIKERNDAYIESETKLSSILTNEINALIAAKPGEKVNVTYLNQLLDSVSSDILGVTDDNIFQLTNNIIQEAQQKGLLLQSDIDALGDALNELLNTYTSLISNGISGSLSRSDATQLQNFAKSNLNVELYDNDFTRTKDGLKLSNDAAMRLYASLRNVDAIAAQMTLESFVDSVQSADGRYESISKTMAHIVELQQQIEDGQYSNLAAVQQELTAYQDMLQLQRQRADSYSFMDNALPEGMQAPENYWNAVGEAYKAMNESATSGYMSIQDFNNIVNEMQNIAMVSGKNLEFMGQTLYADGTGAADLINQAMLALSNIDGEGVKIDLSKLGVDLSAGADSMSNGFDEAIHTMAESQIAMLDAEINLLEAIVAMEDLGDIDIDKNGLNLNEIFEFNEEDNTITGFTENWNTAREKIVAAMAGNEKLNEAFNSIKIAGHTLAEIISAPYEELKNLGFNENEYTELMNSIVQMATSGDYSLSNVIKSVSDVLASSGMTTEIQAGSNTVAVGYGMTLVRDETKDVYIVDGKEYPDPELALQAAALSAQRGIENIQLNTKTNQMEGTWQIADIASFEVVFEDNQIKYRSGNLTFNSQQEAVNYMWEHNVGTAGFNNKQEWAKHYNIPLELVPDFKVNTETLATASASAKQELAQQLATGQVTEQALVNVGIEYNKDLSNLSDADLQQIADLAGIERKTVALDLAADITGDYGDAIKKLLTDQSLTIPLSLELASGEESSNIDVSNLLDDQTIETLTVTVLALNLLKGYTDENINESDLTLPTESNQSITLDVLVKAIKLIKNFLAADTSEIEKAVPSELQKSKIEVLVAALNLFAASGMTTNEEGIKTDLPTQLSTLITSLKAYVQLLEVAPDENNFDYSTKDVPLPTITKESLKNLKILLNQLEIIAGEKFTTNSADVIPVEDSTLTDASINSLCVQLLSLMLNWSGDANYNTSNLFDDESNTINLDKEVNAIAYVGSLTLKQRGNELQTQLANLYNSANFGLANLPQDSNSWDTDTQNKVKNAQEYLTVLQQLQTVEGALLTGQDRNILTNISNLNMNGDAPEQIAALATQAEQLLNMDDSNLQQMTTIINELSQALGGLSPEQFIALASALLDMATYAGEIFGKDWAGLANNLRDISAQNFSNFQFLSSKLSTILTQVLSIWSTVRNFANQSFSVNLTETHTVVEGTSGTGSAKGNALARGRGTLMGELGPELWVSGGHYYVAGQNGAEFVDLPDDAIVFNHLQTKKLLGSGKGGRGTAVTNEKNAVARASGTTGPAMASAREALAQLKQIRAMWQAMLGATAKELGSMAGRGGGGSSGGGDGEKFSPELGDYERWYNWLRQIEKLEQQITLEEAKRENMRNGHAYGKSLQDEIDKLHKEIEVSQELSNKQKEFYELRRKEQAKSMFGQIFTYDQDGLMQYRENVVDDLLAKLNETDEHGNLTGAAESAVKQVSYLQDWIAAHPYKDENGNVTTFDLSDLMIDPETGKKWKANNEEDAAKIMERFWDEFDGWIDELDGLYDSYNDKLKDIEDLIAKENELLQEYVDNQLELEDRIMKAIEAREQALIDTMNKEKDALAEASSAYITGLTDALNKERQMYDRNKDDQETTRLQRQLGILQRSGGSAAEIRSLQEQISDRLQDSYFDAQQAQIDAVKEASDLELERLEQQIEIAQETLDFYKEHGLFNEEMEAIMRGSDEEIISFITTHDGEWAGLSELAHDEQLRELTQMVQLWTEDRGKEMGWKEWRDAALQADKTLTAGDLDKFHDVYGTTFKAALDSGDSPEVARAKATAAAEAELQKHKAKGTGETQQEETTTTTQTETETKQFEPFTGSISSGGRYLYEQPSESSKKIGHFGPEVGTSKTFKVLDYDPTHPGWAFVEAPVQGGGKKQGWMRVTGGSIDLATRQRLGIDTGVSGGGSGTGVTSKPSTPSSGKDDPTLRTDSGARYVDLLRSTASDPSLMGPIYNANSMLGTLPASTIDNTNNSRIINFYDSHFELASETTQDVIMELNQKMNPYVK